TIFRRQNSGPDYRDLDTDARGKSADHLSANRPPPFPAVPKTFLTVVSPLERDYALYHSVRTSCSCTLTLPVSNAPDPLLPDRSASACRPAAAQRPGTGAY